MKKTIPFTIASKKNKILRDKFIKRSPRPIYPTNYKTLLQKNLKIGEIWGIFMKWKIQHC